MKKVVIFANTSWYIKNFRLSTIKRFKDEGYSVTCISGDDVYAAHLRSAGADFRKIFLVPSSSNPFIEFVSLISVFFNLLLLRPNCCFTFTPKCNFYGSFVGRLLGIPIAVNISGLGEGLRNEKLLGKIVSIFYAFTFRSANFVFFQNTDDMNFYESKFPGLLGRSLLLPGSGVDLVRFFPASVENEIPVLGFFARLIPSKGIRVFVDAIARIKLERDVRGIVAGPIDTSRSHAITHAEVLTWEKYGLIEYFGSQDDILPLMQSVDCVVLPSFYPEGTPRVLLEALACGKIVITTDTPGCRDAVDGNGFLVSPDNVDELVDAINSFLDLVSEDFLSLSSSSRKLAESKFDERLAIEPYLEFARHI